MTQMATQLFVRFRGEVPDGFQLGRPYPVFAIDAFEKNGSDVTEFLLADHDDRFRWVPMDRLERVPPKRRDELRKPPRGENHAV